MGQLCMLHNPEAEVGPCLKAGGADAGSAWMHAGRLEGADVGSARRQRGHALSPLD